MWVADIGEVKLYSYNLPVSDNADLRSITVDGERVAGFDPAVTGYSHRVDETATQVTVAAAARQLLAEVTAITPADADPTAAGHQMDLSPGGNTVSVTVTAQDGVSTRTHTIQVGRDVLTATGVINGESGPARHRVALLSGHSYRFTVTGGEIAAPRIGLISAYGDVVAESGDVVVAEGGGELTVHRDHWYQGWMGSSYPHFHEEAKRRDANPCADRDCGPGDAENYGEGPGASLRYRYFTVSSVFDASRHYFVEVRGGYRDTGWAGYTISQEELSDDFSSAADTTGAVAVGGSADGAVDFEHDVDWFRVSLEAGASYRISVVKRSGAGVSDSLERPAAGRGLRRGRLLPGERLLHERQRRQGEPDGGDLHRGGGRRLLHRGRQRAERGSDGSAASEPTLFEDREHAEMARRLQL